MSERNRTTGVILAGGRSRRMGQDKLPLKVGDVTLLDRVYDVLTSRCAEVVVVGPGRNYPPGSRQVPDRRPGQGPLAGIEAGLLAAHHRCVFVAAGDMPFLTSSLVGYASGLLCEHVSAVVPNFEGRLHPLCAAYGREIRPTVSAALDGGVRSVRELLEDLPSVRHVGKDELRRFGNPHALLMNVNSPEDLVRARTALRKGILRSV